MQDHTPGDTPDGLCAFPVCTNPVSQKLPHPICDGHVVSIYRSAKHWLDELGIGPRQRGPKNEAPEGVVYFVRLGSLIKIGFTRHLAGRLRDLPHEEVLGILQGTMAREKALHRRFAHLRHHGEWFTDCPELRQFIAEEAA